LAVLSAARVPDLPEVPTATESGFAGLVVTTWTGSSLEFSIPLPQAVL
jgi:tripartite-type tricarboxylate transporter receptor subunit TctC